MEIIIYCDDKSSYDNYCKIADEIIKRNYLRDFSIHSSRPKKADELKLIIKEKMLYFVIINCIQFSDWYEVMCSIGAMHNNVMFCMISSGTAASALALNSACPVFGYVQYEHSNYIAQLEHIFKRLHSKIISTSSGLFAKTEDYFKQFVSFDDILYIETIKQTHYCTVHAKNLEETRIKADISKLLTRLDMRFCKCRSSTIANLNNVIGMDYKQALLLFADDISCSYSSRERSRIQKQLFMHRVAQR